MRRGDVAIDARLDLHGLTQAEAHSRLLRFVSMAVAQQLRVLLVITGKGSRSDSGGRETGVLRRNLPHWLKQSGMSANILAITPAHPRHGGGGAYYVALRRARDR
jgi:DNA-nicking Smr family endonuclease